VLAAVGALVVVELRAACPPGGPLAFGSCDRVRPFAIAVVALAAFLYVTGLTGVYAWTSGLLRRGVATVALRATGTCWLPPSGCRLPLSWRSPWRPPSARMVA
jgi:hypothetical protein